MANNVIAPTTTESRNPNTLAIDAVPTLEMVTIMNAEDHKVADAVQQTLPQIAKAIDRIAARVAEGGRLIYMGSGTSGRLGILDASECPPTFNTPYDLVIGLIAGGPEAITRAQEDAEDDHSAGARDIADLAVTGRDTVVGLTTSGGTPYVLGGLAEARARGALTIGVTCNRPALIDTYADITISVIVGPEVVTGSTRLKAGTAQKMVLNMLSTGVMIRLGKTYGNLMVDLRATNAKLRDRARRIVAQACDIEEDQAAEVLQQCNQEVKTAIVTVLAGVKPDQARQRLADHDGVVRDALRDTYG
ncbi:MAG: N-acetylmuramic acid 6-phosphate etherase [Anaerolineae bacterium]|nr:N-acetylmuramic acid 6-phosphate etherase [Anaerolineae bacterium]